MDNKKSLNMLLCKARLEWTENGSIDSDCDLRQAITVANGLIVSVQCLLDRREADRKQSCTTTAARSV